MGARENKFQIDKTYMTFIVIILQVQFFWYAVSKTTLVEECQINSNTNQILQAICKKKRRKMCNKFKSKKDKSVLCNL